jgi:alpha/beta superfamily hydrolase
MRQFTAQGSSDGAHATARWTHAGSGTAEEAAFLDSGNARIIAFLHSPVLDPPSALVVMCGSLFEDLHVNYRTELLLARELAVRGCAVTRFHYRQTGNSDDLVDGVVTFESMTRDVRAALDRLRNRWPSVPLVLCGFRLGSLVAAALAEEVDASLVVWSPVATGAEYFRRLSRASRVAGVRATASQRGEAGGLESDLRAGRPVEMLAHLVQPGTYADLSPRHLPDEVGQRRVLFLEMGLGRTKSDELSEVARRWRGAGAAVVTKQVSARQQWFVPDKWEPEDARPETAFIVTAIADWVTT